MTFSAIRQNLKNIDYAWNKPQTYLVFVPGLSLVIQKIQMASALPLNTEGEFKILTGETKLSISDAAQAVFESNKRSKKFEAICKWHLRGSMVQILVSAVAIKFFATPLLTIFLMISAFELGDTSFKALTNRITTFEYASNRDGTRTMHSKTAFNPF